MIASSFPPALQQALGSPCKGTSPVLDGTSIPARSSSMAALIPSHSCDTLSLRAATLTQRRARCRQQSRGSVDCSRASVLGSSRSTAASLSGSLASECSLVSLPAIFSFKHKQKHKNSCWAGFPKSSSEDMQPLLVHPPQLGKPTLGRTSAAQASIADDEAEAPSSSSGQGQSTEDLLLSCTTFNVLAPIYKRLGKEEVRESSFREEWLPRNQKILSTLLERKSSIICLQELWLENPELVGMYEDAFRKEGYSVFKLPRTNNRGDGLLTAVREDKLQVVDHADLHFNDSGDRVAQFLWLRSAAQGEEDEDSNGDGKKGGSPMEMIVVNTHLLFPHDSTSSFIRLRQVYKVLEHLESYKAEHGLGRVPILLCGDLNGSKQGQVFKFLSSQGFASSYDIAHSYPDKDERWVSHRNHKGVVCGVDFIWLLNPSEQCSPLSADWKAAVFRFLRQKLNAIGYRNERQAFDFFCSAGEESESEAWQDDEEEEKDRPFAGPLSFPGNLHHDEDVASQTGADHVITITDFESAVDQLGHEMGLTSLEVRELMESVDIDGNGVVDYHEFKAVVRQLSEEPTVLRRRRSRDAVSRGSGPATLERDGRGQRPFQEPVSFDVRDATLFPPETKDGVWPQDYVLSDHAVLTAVFSPREKPKGAYGDDDLCAALYDV